MTNNWLVICQEQNITTQVLQANQHSQRFGLVLTEEDAKLIARGKQPHLKGTNARRIWPWHCSKNHL
jgi:hypothetical protein